MASTNPNGNSSCSTGRGVSSFEEWVKLIRPAHSELARTLYLLIVESLTEYDFSFKWGKPCFSVAGAKRCYIADQSNYIHLGFYNGAHLTNTDKLIEGSGKNLRHIKLTSLKDEQLRERIQAAIRESAALNPALSSN